MTNTLAIAIIATIAAFLLLDHYVFGLDAGLHVLRSGFSFIDYVSFWR